MDIEIVRADPAGNITVFVLSPLDSMERARAAQALLADPELKAEQVGFVTPFLKGAPSSEGAFPAEQGCWRLEMAGGEFCGNASRSLGLLAAARSGLSGTHCLTIEVSGISGTLPVCIDTEAQTAGIEIPAPLAQTAISLDGRHYPVYEFEGITHIIAADLPPDTQLARSIIRCLNDDRLAAGRRPFSALGVMFFNTRRRFMQPVVWTRELDTLVCESSCGSGSAALGVWAARDTVDTELVLDIEQPGGVITVSVAKQAGNIQHLSISGKVTLSESFIFTV